MALRLTSPTSAGDTTVAVSDHARYVARRRLLESGLAADATGPAAARALLVVADNGLDALADTPAEPMFLNYTGVALYELGALRGAEALFRAARSLRPSDKQPAKNLREVKRARKAGFRVDLPPDVAREVPRLEQRANQLAARAGRAGTDSGTIALCMIVKDEERVLERCLASARDVVDEIVVVDTGSTDGTVAIAERFGATVLHHAWNDDFAEARNVGLDAATSDWILFLDADEWLEDDDAPKLRDLASRTWIEAYRLPIHNRHGHEGEQKIAVHEAMRFFRNRPDRRFFGRVHEGVDRTLPADAPERIDVGAVRIGHDGYLERTKQEKSKGERNLTLLLRQVEEEPNSAFVRFNLATEYAAAGDLKTAGEHFERSWSLLRREPNASSQPFAPPLLARYSDTLRGLARYDEAVKLADEGLVLFPDFTDLVYVQANVARARGESEHAETLLRRCLALGDAPTHYVRSVGAGTFSAAVDLAYVLRTRGESELAEQLLRQTLSDHPEIVNVTTALADAMLARGASPDEIAIAVADRVKPLSADHRYALAGSFADAGQPAAAETQLHEVLEADPGHDPARAALAEVLLAQSRFADAGVAAAALPEESVLAPTAAVTQAFAAIVTGDEALLDEALFRAERVGTPDADRAMLAAWSGRDDGSALSLRALPRLLTCLEALLRVHAFDPFGRLLPLAERVDGLPPRERHELLAQIYLRRGFLDSAAEEWATACDEQGAPDARALAGLAQVAAAGGNADDARVFAEGALELDPGAAPASRVLAALAA